MSSLCAAQVGQISYGHVAPLLRCLHFYEQTTNESFIAEPFNALKLDELIRNNQVNAWCLVAAVAHEYYACGSEQKRAFFRNMKAIALSGESIALLWRTDPTL